MLCSKLFVGGMRSSPRGGLGSLVDWDGLHLAVKSVNISLSGASKHFSPRRCGEFHSSVFGNGFAVAILAPNGHKKLEWLVASAIPHGIPKHHAS